MHVFGVNSKIGSHSRVYFLENENVILRKPRGGFIGIMTGNNMCCCQGNESLFFV